MGAFDAGWLAVAQIVNDDDLFAGLVKSVDDVSADVADKIVANFHAMTQNLGGGTVLAFPPEPAEEPKK